MKSHLEKLGINKKKWNSYSIEKREEIINKKYREKSLLYHPDGKKPNSEKFKEITESKEYLEKNIHSDLKENNYDYNLKNNTNTNTNKEYNKKYNNKDKDKDKNVENNNKQSYIFKLFFTGLFLSLIYVLFFTDILSFIDIFLGIYILFVGGLFFFNLSKGNLVKSLIIFILGILGYGLIIDIIYYLGVLGLIDIDTTQDNIVLEENKIKLVDDVREYDDNNVVIKDFDSSNYNIILEYSNKTEELNYNNNIMIEEEKEYKFLIIEERNDKVVFEENFTYNP